MSTLLLFSVYDAAVGAYAAPFCARTKGEAIRSFTDACSDEKLPFLKSPKDYSLQYLGTFEDGTGCCQSVGPPVILIRADEIVDIGVDGKPQLRLIR